LRDLLSFISTALHVQKNKYHKDAARMRTQMKSFAQGHEKQISNVPKTFRPWQSFILQIELLAPLAGNKVSPL
jgi:hypothetical protein